MSLPKITIITPSFNQGEFLEETIRSVLEQDYPNLEYFVVDGGSKDNSVEIIKKYERHIDWWVSEKDRGQQHAINKGLEKATGEVINYINSDDFLLPGALEIVAEAYKAHPEAGLFMGNGVLVDRQGNKIRTYSRRVAFDYEALLKGSNYVLQQSTFFTRRSIQEFGMLDEALHFAADLEFFLRIGNKYSVVTIDAELAAFRWYEEIKTASGGFKQWVALWDVIGRYTKDSLTPGLLVEFFNVLQQKNVQDDLQIDGLADYAQKSFWTFYNKMQKKLGTDDCIPIINRGIPFSPKKSTLEKKQQKKQTAPAVLQHPGSKPIVDIVLPQGHSWFVREGYVQALKLAGCLGKVFYIPSWTPEDGRSQILYTYLENPQADVIFLMDTIWHAQQVHNTPSWKQQWQAAPIKKILFSFECMSNPWLKSNQDWWRDNITAVDNALPCVDGVIFAHEIDQELFSNYGKPSFWQPFAIDEAIFPPSIDYMNKKPRGFFKGKAIQYYGDDIWYRSRRQLIDFFKQSSNVDVIDQYDDSGPTIDKNKRFLQEINQYQIILGFPSLSPTMVVRPFEALGCKCVFFQNKVLGERTNQLFEDGKDLFFYDPEDPQSLARAVDHVLKNPDLGEQVARNGYEKVMERHTIKHRVAEALEWIDRTIPQIEKSAKPAEMAREPTTTHIIENARGKKILIDGVTFLFQKNRPAGISRVWTALLKELAKTDLAKDIVLLDREGTSPQIPGITRRLIESYDYQHFEPDSLYLQTICEEENAGLFISTYYTYPENTNSVIMLHDMIPEVKGQDLMHPEWRAKAKAIDKACAYLCVSQSTMNDFRKLYPQYADRKIYLTPNAVSEQFCLHSEDEITRFKNKYGIRKPYFLFVGRRMLYKNAILFFRAFSLLKNKTDFEIVCTGEKVELEKMFKPFVQGVKVHILVLNDDELSTAYSGAVALVYPSQYEGFGLPILEAQRSGCPVITCRNSSLPEVAGDAVYFTDEVDVAQMREALEEIQKPDVRNRLLALGVENTKRFSWHTTGQKLYSALQEIRQTIEGTPLKPTDAINTVGRLVQYLNRQSFKGKLLGEKLNQLEKCFMGKIPFNYLAILECEDKLISELPEFLDQLLSHIDRLDDCDSLLLYVIGLAFEGKGSLNEALGAYSGALKMPPDEKLIWNYRVRVGYRAADLAYRLGEFSLAKKTLTNVVLELQSDHEGAIALLFKVNKELGELKSSNQDLISPQLKPSPGRNFQDTPLVSVLVSAYNAEEYMSGLLDDLEAQTIAGHTEIIIIDSGSTQNERAIVETYQKQYPNIQYLRTDKRESVYAAWNRAVKVARGKYLTNANTDDRHAPDAFEVMVNELEEQPDVGVVYGDCAVTYKKNTTLVQGPISGRFRWPDFNRRLLFQVCFVGPQPMWRRSLHDQFGLFDERMQSAGDYEFWLRISEKVRFHHIPRILGLYLLDEKSIEHRQSSLSIAEAQEARQRYWKNRGEDLPPALGPVFLENYQSPPKTDKKLPLVSVIVPTYNRPKELAAALQSIVNQTYSPVEVIVINDGGKDIELVIQRFEKKLPVIYINQPENRGAGASRNAGMAMAKGKYIAFLDDDDQYRPEHLYMLVAELETNPGIVAAYTDALQIAVEQNGEKSKVIFKDVYYSIDFSPQLLMVRNYIPNLCLAFRREALDLTGLFDEQMTALEDWEWLIRLSKVGPFRHIPVVTAEYIVRQKEKSRNILATEEIAVLYKRIYSAYPECSSKQVQAARRRFYKTMTGRELDLSDSEERVTAKSNGRAVETLQLLLDSDDLAQSLIRYEDRLDSDLLQLVLENAETARADGNHELAEGLSDLAEYIDTLLHQR